MPIHGVLVQGINVQAGPVPAVQPHKLKDGSTMVMCVARKKHDRPLKWPMQSKYLQNPDLKA